jgi:membrane protein YqaA with SNARE-associated domain
MLQRLYDSTLRLAAGRNAMLAMAAIAFAESSFFPIPPDILLIPMILANRRQAWLIATVATVSSVVGGYVGYAIGHYLYQSVGIPILNIYGLTEQFDAYREMFQQHGTLIILLKGMTPIPYKLVTIAAGVSDFDLLAFTGASLISRGIRFFLLAVLLWKFGEPIKLFIEKRLMLVTSAAAALIIIGFVLLKFL